MVGVTAHDSIGNSTFEVRAKAIINCTGVFADDILQMDNPEAKASIRPSQGVHIVLDKSFLPGEEAIMVPHTTDGRVLFAVPWHDVVVVGTTDTPLKERTNDPVATEEEILSRMHRCPLMCTLIRISLGVPPPGDPPQEDVS